MKKIISLLLCLSLFFPGALAFAASEEQESHVSGDYKYIILDNGTAAIIGYSGKTENLEIPEKLDGLTVTIIGGYAFRQIQPYICYNP